MAYAYKRGEDNPKSNMLKMVASLQLVISLCQVVTIHKIEVRNGLLKMLGVSLCRL